MDRMVYMYGEGALSTGSDDRWAGIKNGLRNPGVTLVVAPRGSGKTTFARKIAGDASAGRTVLVTREMDFDALGRLVRAELGRERPGDLVIWDGIDEPRDRKAPYWLRELVGRKWTEQVHLLILASRPFDNVEAVSKAMHRRNGRTFRVFDLNQSVRDLERGLRESSDVNSRDAGALLELLQSSSHNIELSGALLVAARSRLYDDRSGTPDLLIVPDRTDKLRVLPSSDLGAANLKLTPGLTVTATPRITYPKTRGFWLPEAARLEDLINDPSVQERDLQSFFEHNPHLLAGTSYDRVVPHPVLVRDESGPLIPDFMLEPVDGFADVLDLKLPRVPIVAGRKDRMRPAAPVSEALAQVREYRAYFEDPAHREAVQERYALQAYRPTVAVVIGRDPGPGRDRFELRRIWDDLPGHVNLMTYDELLRQVRRIAHF